MIKHGIDIVHISRFKEIFREHEQYFKEKVFTETEYARFVSNKKDIKHLAGVFAGKEAVIKALEATERSWTEIEIQNKENGAPFIKRCDFAPSKHTSSLSVSHDGDYAVASVVFSSL